MAIISFLGGPVIKGLIDAYNAKLKAGNVDSKIAAAIMAAPIKIGIELGGPVRSGVPVRLV